MKGMHRTFVDLWKARFPHIFDLWLLGLVQIIAFLIGLMAQEEALNKRGKGVLTLTGCKDLSGKHPVSALLELCTRRRWGPPSFSQVSDAPEEGNYVTIS